MANKRIIVLIGQSHTVGIVHNNFLKATRPPGTTGENGDHWHNSAVPNGTGNVYVWDSTAGAWAAYVPRTHSNHGPLESYIPTVRTTFGPDVEFMRSFVAKFPNEDLYFFKFSAIKSLNDVAAGSWAKNAVNGVVKVYKDMLTQWELAASKIRDGSALGASVGDLPKVEVIMWAQGENDIDATHSAAYQANLTAHVADLRTDFLEHVSDDPIPMVIQQLGYIDTTIFVPPVSTWTETIKAAQAAVAAATTKCALAVVDTLRNFADGDTIATHFSGEAIFAEARILYAAYLEALADGATVTASKQAKTGYLGDGSTTDFLVGFPYLDKDHVEVSVAGVVQTRTTHYTFSSDGLTISIITPPVLNATVDFLRQTPHPALLVNFQNAASLTAANLERAFKQPLYYIEEVEDKV